jgi:hypothetical protein
MVHRPFWVLPEPALTLNQGKNSPCPEASFGSNLLHKVTIFIHATESLLSAISADDWQTDRNYHICRNCWHWWNIKVWKLLVETFSTLPRVGEPVSQLCITLLISHHYSLQPLIALQISCSLLLITITGHGQFLYKGLTRIGRALKHM